MASVLVPESFSSHFGDKIELRLLKIQSSRLAYRYVDVITDVKFRIRLNGSDREITCELPKEKSVYMMLIVEEIRNQLLKIDRDHMTVPNPLMEGRVSTIKSAVFDFEAHFQDQTGLIERLTFKEHYGLVPKILPPLFEKTVVRDGRPLTMITSTPEQIEAIFQDHLRRVAEVPFEKYYGVHHPKPPVKNE